MSISELQSLPFQYPVGDEGNVLSHKVKKVEHEGKGYYIKLRTLAREAVAKDHWEECDEVEFLTFFKGLGVFEEIVDHDDASYAVDEIKGHRMKEFLDVVKNEREKFGVVGRMVDGFEREEIMADTFSKMLYNQMLGVIHQDFHEHNLMVENGRKVRFIDVESVAILDRRMFESKEMYMDWFLHQWQEWVPLLTESFPSFSVDKRFPKELCKRIFKIHKAVFDLPPRDRQEYMWKHIKDYIWGLYTDFEEHGFPEELTNKIFAKYIVLVAPFMDSKGEFVSNPFDLENELWNELKESSILSPFLSLALQQKLTSQHHSDRMSWYETTKEPYRRTASEGTLDFEILQEIRSRS
jgi:hypothetical protein